jgi:DNA-directed RNA polymerase specialized sigma24 family protein
MDTNETTDAAVTNKPKPSQAVDDALRRYAAEPIETNFNTFYAALTSFLCSSLGNSDDLCQDVSIAVWQRVTSATEPALEDPVQWLTGVIRSQKRFVRWRNHKRRVAETTVAIREGDTYTESFLIEEYDSKTYVLSQLTLQEKAICEWLYSRRGQVPADVVSTVRRDAVSTKRKVQQLVVDEFSLAV